MAKNSEKLENSNGTVAATTDYSYASILEGVPTGLLLGGEFRPASNGETFDVINPATDNPLVKVASATEEDAKRALDDAVAAQQEWKATPPRKRSEILYRAFEFIRRDADKLAQLQSLEMGRALPDSKAEVGYGGEFFRLVRRGGRAYLRRLPNFSERNLARRGD